VSSSIDGTVRPPALQKKRVAAQEAAQEVSLFPNEQVTQVNGTVCTPALQEEEGAAQEAVQEGGLLLHCSCKEDRVTCELSSAQEAEQDIILFPCHIKQLAHYSARGAAHQGGPSLSLPTKYSLHHTGENSSLLESDASTCHIETSVLSHEEWVSSPEKSPNLVIVTPTKSTLCSPYSLALMLEQVPTPQRKAYFSVILGNKKCALSLIK
jgi:hypothetical protein